MREINQGSLFVHDNFEMPVGPSRTEEKMGAFILESRRMCEVEEYCKLVNFPEGL